MFRGATLVNLDSKGRLSVPTRYRDQLIENASGQMVCTIDINHPCLAALHFTRMGNYRAKAVATVEHEPAGTPRAAVVVGSCQ